LNLICKVLGHQPTCVDRKKLTASCSRCGTGLEVTYDMCYGETVVVRELSTTEMERTNGNTAPEKKE
jgi:hypothetical protein